MKSAFETNIEALINPKTGLGVITKKILDSQQPFKNDFLKEQNLTLIQYRELTDIEKNEIQTKWVNSSQFKQITNIC